MDNKNNRLFYWNVKDFLSNQSKPTLTKKKDSLKDAVGGILSENKIYRQNNFNENEQLTEDVNKYLSRWATDENKYNPTNKGYAKNSLSNPFNLVEQLAPVANNPMAASSAGGSMNPMTRRQSSILQTGLNAPNQMVDSSMGGSNMPNAIQNVQSTIGQAVQGAQTLGMKAPSKFSAFTSSRGFNAMNGTGVSDQEVVSLDAQRAQGMQNTLGAVKSLLSTPSLPSTTSALPPGTPGTVQQGPPSPTTAGTLPPGTPGTVQQGPPSSAANTGLPVPPPPAPISIAPGTPAPQQTSPEQDVIDKRAAARTKTYSDAQKREIRAAEDRVTFLRNTDPNSVAGGRARYAVNLQQAERALEDAKAKQLPTPENIRGEVAKEAAAVPAGTPGTIQQGPPSPTTSQPTGKKKLGEEKLTGNLVTKRLFETLTLTPQQASRRTSDIVTNAHDIATAGAPAARTAQTATSPSFVSQVKTKTAEELAKEVQGIKDLPKLPGKVASGTVKAVTSPIETIGKVVQTAKGVAKATPLLAAAYEAGELTSDVADAGMKAIGVPEPVRHVGKEAVSWGTMAGTATAAAELLAGAELGAAGAAGLAAAGPAALAGALALPVAVVSGGLGYMASDAALESKAGQAATQALTGAAVKHLGAAPTGTEEEKKAKISAEGKRIADEAAKQRNAAAEEQQKLQNEIDERRRKAAERRAAAPALEKQALKPQ